MTSPFREDTARRQLHVARCVALLFGAVVALSGRAANPSSEEDAAVWRGAKTYAVTVEESYDPAAKIELPFANVLSAFLDAAGLHVAEKGQAADVIVRVHASGAPLARDYDNIHQQDTKTHAFSGADLSGHCDVVKNGKTRPAFTFDRQWAAPDVIRKPYPTPEDAPFGAPFDEFVAQAADWVGRTFGAKPLLTIVATDSSNQLVTDVPALQLAAAEAAAKYGRDTAIPALRARLGDGGPPQRAAAARGLRLAGDHASLPDLVADLNEDDGKLKEDDYSGWAVQIVNLDEAAEPIDNELGEYDAGVEILAAVCTLYRPTDRKLLLDALSDTTSVMRRIDAAIVFGKARDAGAVTPLIAALKDDNALVRAAAANALGAIGDQRAVAPLKQLAKADDGSADVTAAQAALEQLATPKGK